MRIKANPEDKDPTIAAMEREGHRKLNAYCRAVQGRQADLARKTGHVQAVMSRMAHGHTPINMEAAIKLEVVTNGELKADELCPSRADLIKNFLATRAEG